MKTDLFQSCGHCWVFQICWHIECITFTASSFRIWNSSTGIPSPPLALFVVMLSKAHLTSHSRTSGSRWVTILKDKNKILFFNVSVYYIETYPCGPSTNGSLSRFRPHHAWSHPWANPLEVWGPWAGSPLSRAPSSPAPLDTSHSPFLPPSWLLSLEPQHSLSKLSVQWKAGLARGPHSEMYLSERNSNTWTFTVKHKACVRWGHIRELPSLPELQEEGFPQEKTLGLSLVGWAGLWALWEEQMASAKAHRHQRPWRIQVVANKPQARCVWGFCSSTIHGRKQSVPCEGSPQLDSFCRPWRAMEGFSQGEIYQLGVKQWFSTKSDFATLLPRGHLAMTTDIFSCHNLENASSI